jgi:hypothetical protein
VLSAIERFVAQLTSCSVPSIWNLGRSRLIASSTGADRGALSLPPRHRRSKHHQNHNTLVSCVVRQQQQDTPKLRRHPIASAGSRSNHTSLPCPCHVRYSPKVVSASQRQSTLNNLVILFSGGPKTKNKHDTHLSRATAPLRNVTRICTPHVPHTHDTHPPQPPS